MIRSGTNFWNDGDFVEGVRTAGSPVAARTVSIVVPLEENLLTCDTQDMAVFVNGTEVGTFFIEAEDTEVVAEFDVSLRAATEFTFRYETTRTVGSGCGSAGILNDIGTIELGEAIAPPDPTDVTFPAAGDTRSISSGANPWNIGDFIEGVRDFGVVGTPTGVTVVIPIERNTLTCDTQDMAVILDGVTVGEFSIAGGDTSVEATFPVRAGVTLPEVTIRYETTRTVDDGCGSAGITNDVGAVTLTFD